MRKGEKRALSRSFSRCLGPFAAQSKRAGILAGLHLGRSHRLNQSVQEKLKKKCSASPETVSILDAACEPGVGQVIIHQ